MASYRRALVSLLGFLLATFSMHTARAFCGFYVSGADQKLFAEATSVVLMRDGTRTVLSMQNDYKGPPEGFAMVVPVPVVLQKEQVKTLPRDVFDRIDQLSAPRLVEYWEQDPCVTGGGRGEGIGLGSVGGLGFGAGGGRLGGEQTTVKVEARFEVGEYDIVILSAQDSSGLDTWLRTNGYKIPEGAEPALRPYVQGGSKFFVAKVNVAKVKFEDGRASLSPLRFYYDSEKFELPARLGMLNSSGTQDLIVHILASNQRYAVANYPNLTIPTNLDVAPATRGQFAAFYAALFDHTIEASKSAVVTEYAWQSGSCDPCPGDAGGLTALDLATLGADVLPLTRDALAHQPGGPAGPVGSIRMLPPVVSPGLPPEVVQRIVRSNYGRVRLCYDQALRVNPSTQGKVVTKFAIGPDGKVTSASVDKSDIADPALGECIARAFRTLSFPAPEKAPRVTVEYPLLLSPTAATVGGGSSLGNFVLTRLHARYTQGALANDLVFTAAPAIVGGRELRNAQGSLDTGATPAPTNAFQGRYAIRHPWTGAVSCASPVRGVWGGPPPGVASTPNAEPARKVAYAPRAQGALATFLPNGAPTATPVAAPAETTDAGANPSVPGVASPAVAPPSRCGCATTGPNSVPFLSALTGLGLLLRRRTRRR
jgi:hypothetical protein